MQHILIVEDDSGIAKNLNILLTNEGYSTETAFSQKSALKLIENNRFDLILLDITLPDGNGFAVCTAVKRSSDTPVIFLTAMDDEVNTVTGLDLGGDDYITKPFRPLELLSRIKSVLRRCNKIEKIFEIEGLKIDMVRGTVHKNDAELFLSALEYRLLLVFVNNQGVVLSREKLLNEIWDIAGEFVNDNTLTVYIKRLRDKIGEDVIKTVRGLGYRL
ncbi:MAG: response regulator transcription factor [Oscillospiraceae bacterium]|nr:response regulator transcription factor [Oscillospiraceae bacterium]